MSFTLKKQNYQLLALPQLDKKALTAFLQANPQLNLETFDFLNTTQVEALDWQGQDPANLLIQLQALQRLLRLTHDLGTAQSLYAQGLHAATQIAAIPTHQFIAQYAGVFATPTSSGETQAQQVHQRALARKSQVVLTYTALVQHHAAHYRATRFNNLTAATVNSYGSLPSYQDLFGELDFCSCQECRSIFSPAAYLVDLMRLQDNYIVPDAQASVVPVLLKDRRPDIATIILDCANTHTLIPKLQIVNEVLLQTLGGNPSYEQLATASYPFNLPFHLPLAQIRLYLGKNKQSLAAIWQTLYANPDKQQQRVIARESLQLSEASWTLDSTPVMDSKTIAGFYGLSASQDPLTTLAAVDVFLAQTGLSYVQLQELLYQDLGASEISQQRNASFFINSNLTQVARGPIDIDTANNQLVNLTIERLDHLHRFIRLSQALGWRFTDLDWALRTLGPMVNSQQGGLPVINDDILSYLAWMQRVCQQHSFSINQVCALIGTLKDSGQQHGPTFFDQVFNSPRVPQPPQWRDDQGHYDLVWLVPNPGKSDVAPASPQDLQIQYALTAALQLSQDDLLCIAQQMLHAGSIPDQKLPLTLVNLSTLYRLSQLPALTGLSIRRCLVILGLPGQPAEALSNLVSALGEKVQKSLELLQQFVVWLKTTPFSVEQLQFMLTGSSQDPDIQNQLLGVDKVTNFIHELQVAIQLTLLTQAQFNIQLVPTLQTIFGNKADSLSIQMYQRLQDKSINYIDLQGVVTSAGAIATAQQVKEALHPILSTLPDSVIALVVITLQASYELQQKNLAQQLASLYNLSPNLVNALEIWGGLSLGYLDGIQATKFGPRNPYAAVPWLQKLLKNPAAKRFQKQAIDPQVIEQLQKLQPYAVLLKSLSLSGAEVEALIEHPAYFGINYQPGQLDNQLPQFTVANIQTLYQFKQLVFSLQDTQNHLLDYFQAVASILLQPIDEQDKQGKIAGLLAKITGWDPVQIQWLLKKLWLLVEPAMWGTVRGIVQLQAYCRLAQQVALDIPTLWQIQQATTATGPDGYASYAALAHALWGGLQKQYKEKLGELAPIQGQLAEATRSALLPLVMFQLRSNKKLPITTARDLYEYLLIDVEVSGVVQTSYIQEAISAVQLYVYRCLHALEPGLLVKKELLNWWSWVENYRVWQANREVFLYPENYTQPELRKDKSPQFTELESALHQHKLNADSAETAARAYIDGIALVANLEIVGSYLSAVDPGNPTKEQTLYLIGRTITQPYTYYHRTATFSLTSDKPTYAITNWASWLKIDLQIHSTCVSPVYAFDRLFLFWTEAKQGPDGKDDKGNPTKQFEATLYYSYYDSNKRWSVPQQLTDPITLPADINTQAAAEGPLWQTVKVIFSDIQQLIYWSWGERKFPQFKVGNLNQQLIVEINQLQEHDLGPCRIYYGEFPVSPTNGLKALTHQEDLYCFYNEYINNGTSLAVYYGLLKDYKFYSKDALYNKEKILVLQGPSPVVFQNQLYFCAESATKASSTIFTVYCSEKGNQDFEKYTEFEPVKPRSEFISSIIYQGLLYYFFNALEGDRSALFYSKIIKGSQPTINLVDRNTLGIPAPVVFENQLYCFYRTLEGNLSYAVLQSNESWERYTIDIVKDISKTSSLSPVVFKNQLYCFYQPNNPNGTSSGQLWYVVLTKEGKWEKMQVPQVDDLLNDFSAIVYQNKLYCFYLTPDPFSKAKKYISYIILWFPFNEREWEFLGVYRKKQTTIPPNVVPGLDLTWTIDRGPDTTQFLTIPGQQPVRLNARVMPTLSQVLLRRGIAGLFSIPTQKTPEVNLDGTLTPTLDLAGANGSYYWELFFHMPWLMAQTLGIQQQFELAKTWYEYIFNPTVIAEDEDLVSGEDPNDRYWRFLGLRSQYNPLLQQELSQPWAEETKVDLQDATQLAAYHDDPFDPHAIARLRPIAYQKTIVMHYIDNLLAWADNLFRQYTRESLVEATMLYVMAYDLLGKDPVSLGPCPLPAPESLKEIANHYQGVIGNIPEFLIRLEQKQVRILATFAQDIPHNYIPGDYFGLPENDQFIAYWKQVAQRLYNIRHNLTIDGTYQQMPLLEPAINPLQLVAAVAAGESVSPALATNQVDVPYYRFAVMIAKAQAMAQTVIQLGQSLLSILEKQDAEKLSLLYNTNQQHLLALSRTSKQDQLSAATNTVAFLQASLQHAQDRVNHYGQLLDKDLNGLGVNGYSSLEIAQLAFESAAIYLHLGTQPMKGVAVAGYLAPKIFGLANGGMDLGSAMLQGASISEGIAHSLAMTAGLLGTVASYERRKEDWSLQQKLAQDDVNQIRYQILAAQYQERVAQEDKKLLEQQIDQEQAIEAFLKNKFTRAQLYQWMVGRLSGLYFQAYQLAYNLALQAEKAWQFERCQDQSFIHANYWEDLYQGLIAGEALQLDLQRMEKSYMDQDLRKFEVEKIISLAQLDPHALQQLKATGTCTFAIGEKDFDYDFPGHYCRQIKTITLSFPALLGPYQNVHATLTQTANKTLLQADENGVKYLLGKHTIQPDRSILRVDARANQQVALSQSTDHPGLFVLNLEDARYLPFEGTGALSSWQLDMPKAYNPISFDTLTDVIIRLQYTACAGDNAFQAIVKSNLGEFAGSRTLAVAQLYSNAWTSFIQEGSPLIFSISSALLRPNLKNYMVTGISMVILPTAAGEQVIQLPTLTFSTVGAQQQNFEFQREVTTGVIVAWKNGFSIPIDHSADCKLAVQSDAGKLMVPSKVNNLLITLTYTAQFD